MSEPACKRAKHDKLAEVRVALRAADRAEWIGHLYEIKYLEQQCEAINRDNHAAQHGELDLVIAQLQQKAARDRQKAAASANKTEAFTCCVCMDRLPLAVLHVNVPCGHAFCKTCITPSRALAATPAECFSCRGTVASVLQTFV